MGVVVGVDVEVLVDAEVLVVGSEVVDVDVEVAVDVAVVEDVCVEVVVDVWTPGPWRPQPPAKRTADKITQATSERAKARFKESLLVESFAGRSYESASATRRRARSERRVPSQPLPTTSSSQYWISALE